MATVVRDRYFLNVLNLSQLTTIKTGEKINPEKARDILDTNIFELLPVQTNRQDQINNFFSEFNELIGNKPNFQDLNLDGAGEYIDENIELLDIQSRISANPNNRQAYITRLNEHAEGDTNNQDKTIESMRDRLNTYLGDVDNIIQEIPDQRPVYENKANGFLKIRKPNQAIIIKAPNDGLLEFQKNDSYLTDGFTITMWVRFVSKTSEGTLFNYGNPLEENGEGFRLETRINQYDGNYYRYISLVVRESDGTLRDNHWGHTGEFGGALGRLSNRSINNIHERVHTSFPQIPTDNLNEWYFICATYNPNINELELDNSSPYFTNRQYWLNHIDENDEIVSNSGLGARCKVEIISKSELLRARGYKIGDLSVTVPS